MKLSHKKPFCLFTAVVFSLSLPFQALAYGPGGEEESQVSQEYDQQTLEKLQDNLLEYEELQNLIHEYNPTVKEARTSLEQTESDYKEIKSSLSFERQDSVAKKDEAKDNGDAENYQYYATQETIYKSSLTMYNKMIKKLSTSSGKKQLSRTERQLTVAAQSLMISLQSLKSQAATLEKTREVYQAQYDLTVTKKAAGLASETDVLSAQNQLISADASLAALAASQEELSSSLFAMVGSDGQNMEIQPVPTADLNQISEINPEEDVQKAIDNNFTLIDARSGGSKTDSAVEKRTRTREETEENVKIEMERLYQAVLQAKTSYESAKAGYESACVAKSTADSKYQTGMQSRAEYLSEELSFQQKKAAMDAADLTLFQALETYAWAVNGIMDI